VPFLAFDGDRRALAEETPSQAQRRRIVGASPRIHSMVRVRVRNARPAAAAAAGARARAEKNLAAAKGIPADRGGRRGGRGGAAGVARGGRRRAVELHRCALALTDKRGAPLGAPPSPPPPRPAGPRARVCVCARAQRAVVGPQRVVSGREAPPPSG
jgi:hypothetical protein